MLTSPQTKPRTAVFPIAPLQLQFTTAIVLVAAVFIIFGDFSEVERFTLVEGSVLVAVAGVISFAFADERTSAHRLLVVPALDVAAIMLLLRELPSAGLGTLLAFPLLWLVSAYRSRTVLVGSSFVILAVWLPRMPGIATVPLDKRSVVNGIATTAALAVVAGMTMWTRARADAQQVLLEGQTGTLESALDRARSGEETVRQLLDAVQFAVLAFDASGRLTTANRASREMAGNLGLAVTPDLRSLPIYLEDGLTPVSEAENPIRQALAESHLHNQKFWLGHPGEPRAALSISTRVLHDRLGKIDQIVLVASDVTAEYEALQARDDLFASVSHELRTPLSSIIGYVDLALDVEGLPEEAEQDLGVVAKNADRMLLLVNDLLAHREREAAGGLTVTKQPMDFVPVVKDSIAAVLPMANDRLISVKVDLPDSLLIQGDALRLRQVVDNLLSNAIKYNREGGFVDVVGGERRDPVQGHLVDVSVTDTGRGMTAEETRRLFERFYRAPSVRQTSVRGSGLGLNISRELVDLHLGTISVSSEPDVGTTMTITLPGREAL